jgi:hypothetical protein
VHVPPMVKGGRKGEGGVRACACVRVQHVRVVKGGRKGEGGVRACACVRVQHVRVQHVRVPPTAPPFGGFTGFLAVVQAVIVG